MKATIVSANDIYRYKDVIPDSVCDSSSVYICAVDEGLTACGWMVLSEHSAGLFIRYLYVDPVYRRMGAATSMIEVAHLYASSHACDMLAVVYDVDPTLFGLNAFLRESGFVQQQGKSILYQCRLKDISAIVRKKDNSESHNYFALSDMSNKDYYGLASRLRDIYPAIMDQDDYDEKLSYVHITESNVPDACVLVTTDNRSARVEMVWNASQNEKVLINLFRKSVQTADKVLNKKSRISFLAINEQGKKLIDVLSDGKAVEIGQTTTQVFAY